MSRRVVLTALLGAVFVIGITLLTAWFFWRQTRQATVQAFTPHETEVDLASLVTRVRALDRLETAGMRVMNVSTITQSYQLIPNALAGDQVTFLATGDVIAGIDLSQLRQDDVRRDRDGTIVIRLPPAQILVTRLDNRQSHVINRKTGWFRKSDVNLESRVRQFAEQSIRSEAIRKGILSQASANAQVKVADLLHALGFPRVRCETAGASPSPG